MPETLAPPGATFEWVRLDGVPETCLWLAVGEHAAVKIATRGDWDRENYDTIEADIDWAVVQEAYPHLWPS